MSHMAEDPRGGTDASAGATPRRPRRPSRSQKVLIAALVLLALPVLSAIGFAGYLNHVVTANVKHEDLLPGPPGAEAAAAGSGTTPAPAVVTGRGQNYLLLGSDARAGVSGGRSDVIVLIHVPDDHAKVQLIHFPRDLYVSIPGHGKDKINAAYAYGGAPLLVRTMQDLLAIHVDHVALIGFEGFKAMTDAVGGVDVNVEEASNEGGYVFTKGTMHLDGDQALAFVRERHQLSQGDISRGRRQLAFLQSLMLKGLSGDTLTNPARLATFINAATANLVVDNGLDVGRLRSEAFALRSLRGSDMRFITAPFSGFATTSAGASIDVVDSARMTALGRAIADDRLDTYAG